MHRLLLIKPSLDFAAFTYPLGLMSVSAALKKARQDVEIRLVDLRLGRHDYRDLDNALKEFRPTCVGLSFLSDEIGPAGECLRRSKALAPNAPILVGGPHPSADPNGTLTNYPEADFVFAGEGEETIVEWFEAWDRGDGDFSDVNGLHWRGSDGSIVSNEPRANIQDLDSLPWPDYEILDTHDYWNEWSMSLMKRRHKYANLFTSRACPYKCTYCHDIFGKGFYARSPENVVAEMKYLQDVRGVEEFEILDDIFNWNAERAKTIFRMAIDQGIKATYTFPNGLRTDLLDEELLDLMKEAGVRHISIAVETASPRLQKQIKKNLRLDKVERNIQACHDRGILTRGFFMIGFPSETKEEVRKTIDYAIRSKLTQAYFFVVVPYEGTELTQQNRELVEAINFDPTDTNYFYSDYNLSAIDDKELIRLKKRAMARFYLSPRRLYYVYRTSQGFAHFLAFGMSGFSQVVLRILGMEKINWSKVRGKIRRRFNELRPQPALADGFGGPDSRVDGGKAA